MTNLLIPTPMLAFTPLSPAAPTTAQAEQPVKVLVPPVQMPDGQPYTLAALAKGRAGFFIYRRQGPGQPQEIWDEAARRWQPEAAARLGELKPGALAYMEGEPMPWQGLLVAAGQADGAGAPVFGGGAGGFPQYTFRAYFAGPFQSAQVEGLSPASAPLAFASAAEAMRVVLGPGDGEKPENATRLRVVLKNAAMQPAGSLEIRAAAGGAEIEIANFTAGGAPNAVLRLLPDGDIRLEPAAGRRVVVAGLLETEHILYLPAGGAVKVTLP